MSGTPERQRPGLLDEQAGGSSRQRAGAVTVALALHAAIIALVMTLSVRVLSHGKLPVDWMEVALPPPPPPALEEKPPEPPPVDAKAPPKVIHPSKTATPEPEPEPPPPAAAEAGQILAAPEEIADFGDSFVTGTGTYAGGVTERGGTSKVAVRDGNARAHGVLGGTGTGKGGGPVKDLSRPPGLAGGGSWDCPFPEEADAEDVNSALVSLKVQVGADGSVSSVNVASDPGFGFGREAKRCALRKKWQPGLDVTGRPTRAVALVNVRFHR